MDPKKIVALLTPRLEEGKVLHIMRGTEQDNSGPLFVHDFDGTLVHATFSTALGSDELKFLEGWEDINSWTYVMIIRTITLDELKIECEREMKVRKHTPHPLAQMLRGRLGDDGSIEFDPPGNSRKN